MKFFNPGKFSYIISLIHPSLLFSVFSWNSLKLGGRPSELIFYSFYLFSPLLFPASLFPPFLALTLSSSCFYLVSGRFNFHLPILLLHFFSFGQSHFKFPNIHSCSLFLSYSILFLITRHTYLDFLRIIEVFLYFFLKYLFPLRVVFPHLLILVSLNLQSFLKCLVIHGCLLMFKNVAIKIWKLCIWGTGLDDWWLSFRMFGGELTAMLHP